MTTLAPTNFHLRMIEPAPAAPDDAFGIYLHIPFCAHICPYCDFNTYSGQESLIPRYVDALVADVEHFAAAVAGRRAATIFFGGGTPSLLPAADIGRVIAACRASFAVDADAEVTLEANPNGLDAAYLAALLDVGVNRLSIGAQTLHRRGLRTLGRRHEAGDVAVALRAARAAGFADVSLDFIFGWPGQRPDDWRADLDRALGGDLGPTPNHLSLYSLIVEPGTPMADAAARGIMTPLDDDAAADLYDIAIDRLAAAGWTHYEVANWAAAPELASRHNAVYWRNGDYLGFGAGAHGHLAGRRWMNHPAPLAYCRAVATGESPIANEETIDAATGMGETMMLGLRLLQTGVDAAAFQRRHGVALGRVFGLQLDELAGLGLLERTPAGVRLTRRGLMLANDVCARFLP
ncbi:MAG TPA: radical SAM family heme chaperone HemW [Thermomicrobiales bacterium]|nr:radical SAM family heme chaperone HemW [Thermomicrobiales bacterium]